VSASIRVIRLSLLGLALLSVLATGYELAAERHWHEPLQLVPWIVLVILVAATGLAALPARRAAIRIARALAGLALLASVFGVYEHVAANFEVGGQDPSYAASWESRPAVVRWLLAATKSVGEAPPIAPGALGQTALIVLLASAIGRAGPGSEPAWSPRPAEPDRAQLSCRE